MYGGNVGVSLGGRGKGLKPCVQLFSIGKGLKPSVDWLKFYYFE